MCFIGAPYPSILVRSDCTMTLHVGGGCSQSFSAFVITNIYIRKRSNGYRQDMSQLRSNIFLFKLQEPPPLKGSLWEVWVKLQIIQEASAPRSATYSP